MAPDAQTSTSFSTSEWLSAGSALLAFVFSIFVYFRTRYLNKPKERPIVSINRIDGETGLINGEEVWGTETHYWFRNTGQHPAGDLRMEIGHCLASNIALFKYDFDQTEASEFLPDAERANAHIIRRGPATAFRPELLQDLPPHEVLPDKETHLIHMIVTYKDSYFPKRSYTSEFWFVLNSGERRVRFATVEQKKSIEHVVRKRA